MIETRCATPDDTFALGARLGRLAPPGTVVVLTGDLGAGKTVFARGVGEGLGIHTRVQSPTFVLVQAHTGGRLPLWHADVYRVDDPEELEQIGLDEVAEADGVTLVEWGERVASWLPADRLEIRIVDDGAGRAVQIRATGPAHRALEAALAG